LQRWYGAEFAAARFDSLYSAHEVITHRIDVRHLTDRKRAAMQAHATQLSADSQLRTLARFTSLPAPLFRLVFGHEWYVQVGRRPMRRKLGDFLDVS
jgi:LmbE family N-acetylglucosaminyl deacetylase